MVKLLIKYMIGLIFLGIISLAVLYIIAARMQQHSLEQAIRDTDSGVLFSLAQQLQRYPEKQWPDIIQSLRPEHANLATVQPLSAITLPKNKMAQLKEGQLVIASGDDILCFGYVILETYSYQRIGNSDYAIQLEATSILAVARRATAWMLRLVKLELSQTPRQQWQQKIHQLQGIYHVPLSMIPLASISIPESVKNSLSHSDFALDRSDTSTHKIKYAYGLIENSDSVVRIGPIQYPLYPQYQSVVLIALFIVISIALIILLTFIFSRNLDKIYRITKQYGQANFSNPPTVSKHSTLNTLYCNILDMGQRIAALMKSQRHLTQFVAHECRTPISTMLFAIDELEKEPLSDKSKKHLANIKIDLADLNALVGEFLNYARYTSQTLKLSLKRVLMNKWLTHCLKKYNVSPKPIKINNQLAHEASAIFDPKLIEHVINNIINNSLKHAETQVILTIKMLDQNIIIHIDNDGRPIQPSDSANIFMPFVQSSYTNDSTTTGVGLGLAIAKAIVDAHQGQITVTDAPIIQGARFTIMIPTR